MTIPRTPGCRILQVLVTAILFGLSLYHTTLPSQEVRINYVGDLPGHSGMVTDVVSAPDGSFLATASWDQTVRLWNLDTRTEIARRKHGSPLDGMALSPDGKVLASIERAGFVFLWDPQRRADLISLKMPSAARELAFSPDGALLYASCVDSTIRVINVASRKVTDMYSGFGTGVWSVDVDPTGRIIATGMHDGTIRLWDTARKLEVGRLTGHQYTVVQVKFSPDGRLIASGSTDATIRLWDIAKRELKATLGAFPGDKVIMAIAFSPDGGILAGSCSDQTLNLWDVNSLRELAVVKSRHEKGKVCGLAFTPDGALLAGACSDNRVRLWDVSSVAGPALSYQTQYAQAAPTYPPVLKATASFVEPSGNNILDADETARLILTLTNSGQGKAFGLQPVITPDSLYTHLAIPASAAVAMLDTAKSISIELPISADHDIGTRPVNITVRVTEANGFDLDPPLKISFGTQQYIPPHLSISDYAIEDFNHNRRIERSEPVTITVRLENSGAGVALDTRADVLVGTNVFITPDSKSTFELGSIAPGEYRDIAFSLFTNNKATGVPLQIMLTEKHGKYGLSESLNLPFEVIQKAPDEIIVAGHVTDLPNVADVPELVADVDKNIPMVTSKRPDAVAVVIGNRNYSCGDVPSVDYALNDASTVRAYLAELMGFSEGNIIYEEDASQSKMRSIFGTADVQGQLANVVKDGVSDVFVYYSGHGAPDPNSKKGYFLPVDCCPNDVRINGYPLATFYANMAKLSPRSLTIVIDACFSGGSHEGMLIRQASPISIEVENPIAVSANTAVFTSSGANEIASWYPEKNHGLFTYFFLRGLRGDADIDGDRAISTHELFAYLSDPTRGVPYYARSIFNGRIQTPSMTGDREMVIVRLPSSD